MKAFLLAAMFLLPICAFAYASVIADPQKASIVLPIAHPESAQEFFGKLNGFPHTFEFVLNEEMNFKAEVWAHDTKMQKNDVSIILVRQEKRGVAEIGRTDIRDAAWLSVRDSLLAESFRSGGNLNAALEPGSYVLEVSAPNNDAAYRLTVGDEIQRSYFENIHVLFEVKKLLHSSVWGAFLSPLLSVPILLLVCACAGIFMYRRHRHTRGIA